MRAEAYTSLTYRDEDTVKSDTWYLSNERSCLRYDVLGLEATSPYLLGDRHDMKMLIEEKD
eukprot:42111-Eustigmatos_ZCMA.PRE.1